MPAFLLLAVVSPRTAHRMVAGAYRVSSLIDDVHEAVSGIAARLMFAADDARAWRRDLGLDGEG